MIKKNSVWCWTFYGLTDGRQTNRRIDVWMVLVCWVCWRYLRCNPRSASFFFVDFHNAHSNPLVLGKEYCPAIVKKANRISFVCVTRLAVEIWCVLFHGPLHFICLFTYLFTYLVICGEIIENASNCVTNDVNFLQSRQYMVLNVTGSWNRRYQWNIFLWKGVLW